MLKILLLTPPLTQFNCPYPATMYLSGFLQQFDYQILQADLSCELIAKIFSKQGLTNLFSEMKKTTKNISENTKRILFLEKKYIETIETVIRFLQNKDSTASLSIISEHFLPQNSRFSQVNSENNDFAFGNLGIRDKARYFATLYLEDIADAIKETTSQHFDFCRYAETLAAPSQNFENLEKNLNEKPNVIDKIYLEILNSYLLDFQPDAVGITIPFAGNVFAALRCGQFIKQFFPKIKIILGGGFVNTELRNLSETKIFQYCDFICLDNGEKPLLKIFHFLENKCEINSLQRTYVLDNQKVKFINNEEKDFSLSEIGTPNYFNIQKEKYFSTIDMLNPMHRLWSDGFWNKLTIAQGCYWHQCAFCDTQLPYIQHFNPTSAKMIVDRMEKIIEQTQEFGFHFVDEAAPPKMLVEVALEILKRKLSIRWWTNIRFERYFSADICKLLAFSGCIAVTGGFETPNNRLLQLMKKGTSIAETALCLKNFTQAGILTHTYLMYGFPSETDQETIDGLEIIRQFFENQIVNSCYWHRFALSFHSFIKENSEKFSIKILTKEINSFANNDLEFVENSNVDHSKFAFGLRKAVYNFMMEIGIENSVNSWFDFSIPKPSIPRNYVFSILQQKEKFDKNKKLIWLENLPEIIFFKNRCELKFYLKNSTEIIRTDSETGGFLIENFSRFLLENQEFTTLGMFLEDYKNRFSTNFLQTDVFAKLREFGLLLI